MTSRRKAALRKAQLVSARKRKGSGRGLAAKVGVLAAVAGGAVGVYGGVKYNSQIKDVAGSVKRSFRSATPNNSAQNAVKPDVKLGNVLQAGVTNAQAARQAPPVNPPNMNNTSTPAPSTNAGPAAKGVPGFGGVARQQGHTQKLLPAESIIDPTPPAKKNRYPAEHLPTMERILDKLGKKQGDVVQEDLWALSQIWADHKISKGVKIKGIGKNQVAIYNSMRDMFQMETKGQREARKKA
jgi:hypothetical protein